MLPPPGVWHGRCNMPEFLAKADLYPNRFKTSKRQEIVSFFFANYSIHFPIIQLLKGVFYQYAIYTK